MIDDWESTLRRDFPEWMDGKAALSFKVKADDTGVPALPPIRGQQRIRQDPEYPFEQWYTRPQLQCAIEAARLKMDAMAFEMPKIPTQGVMPGVFNPR